MPKLNSGWIAASLVLGVSLQCGWPPPVHAQSDDQSPAAVEATTPPIVAGQKSVAERFSRLEMLLLRSADLEAADNPTRAALLQQAVQLSKQAELTELLADAATRLEQGQYSEAIEKQKSSRESLKRLLELLQSENREQRIREQRDEVRRWIEETDRLLRLQSSLRGRTEGGQALEQAAQDQEKLTRKATDIAAELQSPQPVDGTPAQSPPDESSPSPKSESSPEDQPAHEAAEPQPGEPQPGELQPGEPQPGESQPGESQPGESQPGESQPGESQPGESQPGESQPGESQPGESSDLQPSEQAGEEQSSPPQSPTERAKQKIEQAQQKMKEAEQELKQAEREGAVEKQRQAEERLREAIEELEEILRQLREEEVERSLASLETRLRRMLDMQTRVLEETTRLQEIAGDDAARQIQITASKLSLDQLKILAEGERALLLLRDEGSSAAFPEAIQQLNVDIQSVADRLQAADVGPLTVVIETEIVSSLEEMVEALVQVQKENREKQQQQQQPGQTPGEPGDQPLVDKLAELRLIRTLQLRVNKRTTTLSDLLDDPADPTGQVTQQDLLEQLQGLAERQLSIQRVTRDIVVGKGE